MTLTVAGRMEQPRKKKIKYICLKCDKVFNRVQRLNDHQSKKSCGTVCAQCNHKFPDRGRLEQHQKNASIIDCSICKKRFCHQADHNNHQRTAHQLNPLQCSTCSKEFSTQQRLKDHKTTAVVIDCDLCVRKLCSQKDYTFHRIADHFVNPCVCKICKKEYKAVAALSECKTTRLWFMWAKVLSPSWLQQTQNHRT